MQNNFSFRRAERQDTPLVLSFIRKIADYEGLLNEVSATVESLEYWLFDEKKADVVFACVDGKEIGFALYFYNFSTFVGKAGIYLEDIFVDKEYRGNGYGKALFKYVASIAVRRGCGRMDWCCLDWNEPSIRFYKSMGAIPMDEWTIYRLQGEALQKFGADS